MRRLALLALMAALCGCSTYTTPGAGVSLAAISERDGDIATAFQRQPAIVFPARLAVVRVAAPGFSSGSNSSFGIGAFGIVTTRDIETEDSFAHLGRLPQVTAIAPISRLLVPPSLDGVRDLRAAAAQLKADALLVYTIDTRFRTETAELGPLQTIALGFLPSKKAVVNATCAFMIVMSAPASSTARAKPPRPRISAPTSGAQATPLNKPGSRRRSMLSRTASARSTSSGPPFWPSTAGRPHDLGGDLQREWAST